MLFAMGKAAPVIYLGPSLSQAKARSIFPEAEFRPPAKKGDLLRTVMDPSITMVGLVDGVFMQDYPPTPIEVYQLVRRKGMVAAGAASLGALRAVELAKFGMIGIGTVFSLFNSGKLCADDEVAVTFGPDYALESEAMIDIRYNLYRAEKRAVISHEARKAMTRAAKMIYFPQRTYDHVAERTLRMHPSLTNEVASFQKFISTNRKSLKERDATKLVQYFKSLMEL